MRIELTLAVIALTVSASAATAQDWTADPTFGNVSLEQGFLPDPWQRDLTAGGSIEVSIGSCSYGHVAEAPDLDLRYDTDGGTDLYFYVIAGDDTTLLINKPDGTWACNDDGFGDGDPIVVIRDADDGLYNIWIGTYGSDLVDAAVYVSEVDPRS